MGISITQELGKYLCVPTINNWVSRQTFQHIIERVDKKLSGWKARTLSTAGRVTLAQSVFSSIPLYAMQSAKLLRSICDEVDKKTHMFIWGGNKEKRKVHLVSWDTLVKPRDKGGLGFRLMQQANCVLLTKLGWRIMQEPQSLWARVLRSKYCKNQSDLDMFEERRDASNAWRGILDNKKLIMKGSRMIIGNEKNTLFWYHRW